jgi:hypothetical protein
VTEELELLFEALTELVDRPFAGREWRINRYRVTTA